MKKLKTRIKQMQFEMILKQMPIKFSYSMFLEKMREHKVELSEHYVVRNLERYRVGKKMYRMNALSD